MPPTHRQRPREDRQQHRPASACLRRRTRATGYRGTKTAARPHPLRAIRERRSNRAVAPTAWSFHRKQPQTRSDGRRVRSRRRHRPPAAPRRPAPLCRRQRRVPALAYPACCRPARRQYRYPRCRRSFPSAAPIRSLTHRAKADLLKGWSAGRRSHRAPRTSPISRPTSSSSAFSIS